MKLAEPFRRDIQGLRAIAVLSVVIFHAGGEWLRGGFAGVDVFFVISGYLITRILLKENAAGTYSLVRFYERRLRRLFPALIIVLIATLIAGLFLLSAHDMKRLGASAAATMFFSSNVLFFLSLDYFSGPAEFEPLLHTWSLAVEEQFYIVFPLFVALVYKRARSLLVPLLLAGTIASLVISIVSTQWSPGFAFYLPFSRAFELLIGALVAASPRLFSSLRPSFRDRSLA
jgi:peptidoglycan/LPS O-acetylase OafA/YrhL